MGKQASIKAQPSSTTDMVCPWHESYFPQISPRGLSGSTITGVGTFRLRQIRASPVHSNNEYIRVALRPHWYNRYTKWVSLLISLSTANIAMSNSCLWINPRHWSGVLEGSSFRLTIWNSKAVVNSGNKSLSRNTLDFPRASCKSIISLFRHPLS